MSNAVQYTDMKDSGVKWIGLIPTTWRTRYLKYLFSIEKRIAGELGHTVLSVTQRGIKPKDMTERGQFALDYSKYQLVYVGDFVMNHMDLLTGWVDISQYDGVTSPDYRVFVNTDSEQYISEYYKYIFQLCYSNRIFYGLGRGVAGFGRWRLPADMFLTFTLPVPPTNEQTAIANFLDEKCNIIDALIEEAKSNLMDYRKWKESIIYEAVTKGLDSDAVLIDTDIPFIGKIPSAWRCVKISRVLENSKDGIRVGPFGSSLTNAVVSSAEGTVKIYGQANLIRKDFAYGDKYVTEETYERLKEYEVKPGDVAVSMMGTIGKCCVVPEGIDLGIMDSHLIKIRLNELIVPAYFEYVYESHAVFSQLLYLSKGSIMTGLNSSIVRSAYITLPDIPTQEKIVEYLNNKLEIIDAIIAKKENLIEDLELYKRSLIFEAVTGKRKVV